MPAIVALVAALIGHVVIDVLGDFMLAHDAYDDLDHSSRAVVALVTAALGTLATALALRAAIREARGSENAFCIAIRSVLPARTSMFVLTTVILSTVLLCLMEACDGLMAGHPLDDLGDLFGGSIAFGGTIVAVIAVAVSLTALAFLRRLSQVRIVAGVVFAFLRRFARSVRRHAHDFEIVHRLIFQTCDICHHVAGRGPPLLPFAPTA